MSLALLSWGPWHLLACLSPVEYVSRDYQWLGTASLLLTAVESLRKESGQALSSPSVSVPRLTLLHQLLKPMASCSRVTQCSEAVPILLQAFFSNVTQVSPLPRSLPYRPHIVRRTQASVWCAGLDPTDSLSCSTLHGLGKRDRKGLLTLQPSGWGGLAAQARAKTACAQSPEFP